MNSDHVETKYSGNYPDGLLGIFAVLSVVFLVWAYCWLKNYGTTINPQKINVVFHQVAGLNTSASVYLDGVRVGIVDKLDWKSRRRVVVTLRLSAPGVVVPRGSKFEIHTNGIVGAKFVEIILPPVKEGEPAPVALTEEDEVIGIDPVRPELAVNKLAIGLSQIDMQEFHDNFESDRKRLVRAADELSELAKISMPVVEGALPLETELMALSKDTRKSLTKVSNLLGDGSVSRDLKTTAKEAKETVQIVRTIVTDINTTVKDKNIRKDLTDSIARLSEASKSVEHSVDKIEKMTENKELREDVKQVLQQAKDALSSADKLLNNKEFSKDIHKTIRKTNDTLEDLDSVAERLNQILDKRFPLPRMIFGRPGHLKKK